MFKYYYKQKSLFIAGLFIVDNGGNNMKVTVNTENTEYDCELEDLLWGKGFNTYRKIRDAYLVEELICHLEKVFSDGEDIIVINNYLAYWLDADKFIATHSKFPHFSLDFN